MSLPFVTEDIKWGDNLVFSIAGKMFCLADLEPPLRVSFKVPEEEFTELTSSESIIQAPYFARMKWVTVLEESRLSQKEWENYLRQTFELVKAKLPKKVQESIS
jgi:predicted DNA-binding protein (MmcQ/YjbR family)